MLLFIVYSLDIWIYNFPFFLQNLYYNYLVFQNMSLTNSSHLTLAKKSVIPNKLFYSQCNEKHQQLIRSDCSKKAMSREATPINASPLKKNTQKTALKAQCAMQNIKKTLIQLENKRKLKQTQIKIIKIKQNFSKMLNNSKQNQSNSQSQNSKIQSEEKADNFYFSDKTSEIQCTSVASKNSNRVQFLQFKNQEGIQSFRILKYVSQGSFGKVYLAQNIQNLAIFSIKVIPRKMITKETEYQLFRQIKIQMFLNHPNIIKLYHFFVDTDNIYLVLEPCLGNDLYKKLKSSSEGLKEREIAGILRQVCQAVQYMHQNDIIHRDIKSQNVLFHENIVKICDFGWAIHSPLLRDTRCGTPLYASPEMLKKQMYDSKIDVWCIGVLTYELIYGKIPFEIRHVQDMEKIIQEQVYFSKKVIISKQAKSFINGCMNKNPFQRYNNSQALQHPFLNNINDKYRCTMAC